MCELCDHPNVYFQLEHLVCPACQSSEHVKHPTASTPCILCRGVILAETEPETSWGLVRRNETRWEILLYNQERGFHDDDLDYVLDVLWVEQTWLHQCPSCLATPLPQTRTDLTIAH